MAHEPTFYLSTFAFISAVFREKTAEEVSTAAGHVHQRSLLSQTKTGRYGQHQSDRLNQQSPLA